VLQALFTWSWLIALLRPRDPLRKLRDRRQGLHHPTLCGMAIGDYQFMRPVCRFFGVR
jgi:hypothetical protein